MSALTVAGDWYETKGLPSGVTRIRERHLDPGLRCNMWHVRGRDRDLLIDSGMGIAPLRGAVAELRERPVLALASHTHFDHVGAHHEFAERLVHPAEADVLRAPGARNTVWADYRGEAVIDALPRAGYSLADYAVVPAPPTRLIEEGDEIDLGDRVLRVFHMPGHSPGSVCVYEASTATLFTGDVLYDGELLDGLYHSDPERYLETMARLKEVPARTFHCGHFESFGRERMLALVDAYVESRT